MKEPKLIYKYTHAQAITNGELRRLPKQFMTMPQYIGYQLDAELKKVGVTDEQLLEAARRAFKEGLNANWSRKKRFTVHYLPVPFDVVLNHQIGDDEDNQIDEGDEVMTLVLVGES